MLKQDFGQLFSEVVSGELTRLGFIERGSSLYLSQGCIQVAWIRGGGRFSQPGTIAHLVCFRHSFLRDKREIVPPDIPRFAEDYPWVVDAELLASNAREDWRFDPPRLMSLPYGRYDYGQLSPVEVRADLRKRRDRFLEYLEWAAHLDINEAEAQIAAFAGEYWVARLWMEDYRAVRGSNSGP